MLRRAGMHCCSVEVRHLGQVGGEGVGHDVEGLHRRQPPSSQVPPHLVLQPYKESLSIPPLAHALHKITTGSQLACELAFKHLDETSSCGIPKLVM